MGYSGRYHAASLVAVFIALAVGILIGIGLADDVVTGASEELESSLRADLEEAQDRVQELESQLEREQQFSFRAYPAVVDGRLAGASVGIVGLGGLPEETVADVEAALEPTGAGISAKAVVALPPNTQALAEAAGPGYKGARRGGGQLARLGQELGTGLAGGSRLLDAVSPELFSRFSGGLDGVDYVVFVPTTLGDDVEEEGVANAEALVRGLLTGAEEGSDGSVAVERTETDPTTLGPASEAGVATVDNADMLGGKAAIVLALLGADGDYGVKERADTFLPDLLESTGPGSADREP